MIYVTASIFNCCAKYWYTQVHCIQGSELHVPKGCAPKIHISLLAYPMAVYTRSISLLEYTTAGYSSSDIGLVYSAVVYTRSISLLVYITTPNVLQCTQFLSSQGSISSMYSMVLRSIFVPFTVYSTSCTQGIVK